MTESNDDVCSLVFVFFYIKKNNLLQSNEEGKKAIPD